MVGLSSDFTSTLGSVGTNNGAITSATTEPKVEVKSELKPTIESVTPVADANQGVQK